METFDIMGVARPRRQIHAHGYIELVDMMPRIVPMGRTADFAVVQAARVSTGQGLKTLEADTALLRYLLRHRHTTPFEMVEFKFNVSLPIFVARQWIRHRTANVNEVSARYTELPDKYYLPGEWRRQGTSNKQGGEEPMEYAPGKYRECSDADYRDYEDAIDTMIEEGNGATSKMIHTAADNLIRMRDANPRVCAEDISLHEYHDRINAGVSRELARTCLPVSMYTQWYWKCDLHNILHFLSLRCDPHAQLEIREYADAMLALIEPYVPETIRAFRDYRLEAVTLTRLELEQLRSEIAALRMERDGFQTALRAAEAAEVARHAATPGYIYEPYAPVHVSRLPISNKRENDEWQSKRTKLGLTT